MFKLGDIAVVARLMLLLSLAWSASSALLLISASALHRNLMSEREARLQAVLDLAMSRIRPWPPPPQEQGQGTGQGHARQHAALAGTTTCSCWMKIVEWWCIP